MQKSLVALFVLSFLLTAFPKPVAHAQSFTPVQCGTILEAEFAKNSERQGYVIDIAAGDKFSVSVTTRAQAPKTSIVVLGPTKLPITDTGGYPVPNPIAETLTLSARGAYQIFIANSYQDKYGRLQDNNYGGLGVYTLSISCLLNDSTIIVPGDSPPPDRLTQDDYVLIPLTVIATRSTVPIECGALFEAEFTTNSEAHSFALQATPDSVFWVSATPIADPRLLGITITILDPTGNPVTDSGGYPKAIPSVQTPILSVRGTYRILVANSYQDERGRLQDNNYGGIGFYTLAIGCSLPDGTFINPGDNVQATPTEEAPASQAASVEVSPDFVGFPGLAPVNFSSVAKLPLMPGLPMSGGITPTGGEILGYMLDANEGDIVDLSLTRLSGNLNLGVVVMSADNQVVFQSSLITSQALSTRLTIPSTGTYTVGVFRIELISPTTPEATAFQVQATINP